MENIWKQNAILDEVYQSPSFLLYEITLGILLFLFLLLSFFYPVQRNDHFTARIETNGKETILYIPVNTKKIEAFDTKEIWIEKQRYSFQITGIEATEKNDFLLTMKIGDKIYNEKGILSVTIKNKPSTIIQKFYNIIKKGIIS